MTSTHPWKSPETKQFFSMSCVCISTLPMCVLVPGVYCQDFGETKGWSSGWAGGGLPHWWATRFFFFFLQMLIEEHSPNTVFICLVAFGDGRGREEEVRSFQNQSVNQKQGNMAKLPGSSWFLRNAKPFLLFPVHPVLCTLPLAQLRSWNHPPSSHFQKEKRQMFCSKDSQRCHPPRPPEKEDHRTRGSAWDFRASAVRDTQPPSGPAQAAPQILAVGKSNILPTWF